MTYAGLLEAGRRYSRPLSRWKDAAIPVAIISACVFASASPESVRLLGYRIPPLCPFKALTGFDCPGCGITRALIFAFHGQWRASYMMHIWGIPLALFFIYRAFSEIYLAATGRSIPPVFSPNLQHWKSHFIALSLAVPWVMKTTALLIFHAF
jgi:hypothetical protein